MTDRISAVSTPGYEDEYMDRAVARHFSALGADDLLLPGMRVTLKPNLLMKRRPEEATTTHPALVAAVIRYLRDKGVEDITIADSPGGPYTRQALSAIYGATGMAAAVEAVGGALNQDCGWRELRGEGALCRDFNIIDPVARADLVINLPKLKTHAMTTLSGGVKNLFGCVPGLQKPQLHFRFPEQERFAQMLVDLAALVGPGLTIVDAVVSMEGDGPSAGRPRKTGMTFASRDVFTLDRALCDYLGLNPEKVPVVRVAMAAGLCPQDSGAIACEGDKPEPVADFAPPSSKPLDFSARLPAWLHRPARYVERRWLTPRPVVRRRGCIGCGKCVESCAPQAVRLKNRRAVIDYGKCIGCYCCHEMCPVRTIGIRRTPLSR